MRWRIDDGVTRVKLLESIPCLEKLLLRENLQEMGDIK